MNNLPAIAMTFNPAKRDYIRRELDMVFSTFATVAEGSYLKTWRAGLLAGKPKLSPAAKSMLERGLVWLDTTGHRPRLFSTEARLTELRLMMADKRLANPEKFAHVMQDLGIEN